MDTLILFINGEYLRIPKTEIGEIKDGKAFHNKTKRWYDIKCLCLDVETILADEETDIPESYIVCNSCNKVTYVKDLKK